jgi:glycerate-2-kinase
MKTSLSAFDFCLRNSDPKKLVYNAVKIKNSQLLLTDILDNITNLNLNNYESIYVVGAGKAAAKMLKAISTILKNRLSGGAINIPHDMGKTKIGNAIKIRHINVTAAGHPLPDEAGVQGTRRIVELLKKATESDLIFCLVSGGGSALLPLPLKGISLDDKQKITNALLAVGATIGEVNIVRKHLSLVKGGRLVRYVTSGCTVVALILSDVIGDEIDIIASGPTVPDRSTFQDAADILKKYDLWHKPFSSVRQLITRGINGEIDDTPKEDDPIFRNVHNILIGNNSRLCNYAVKYLEKHVNTVLNLGSSFNGEAREFGFFLADLGKDAVRAPDSVALVLGGETTVTLNRSQRNGLGGRNQEAVLSAALKCTFQPKVDIAILCVSTDGVDGNSKAAGAILTPKTMSRIKESMRVKEYLYKHDSYSALRKLRSLIITGRTGTNLNDIAIVCKIA